MKLVCKGQHWEIKDGQLLLDTPEGQEAVRTMVKVLERQIRVQIHAEICDLNLTDNRSQIVKNGLENSLLTVQDLCARVALGDTNEQIG
jgi:hypothetical protein